jgi:hypothetical protein
MEVRLKFKTEMKDAAMNAFEKEIKAAPFHARLQVKASCVETDEGVDMILKYTNISPVGKMISASKTMRLAFEAEALPALIKAWESVLSKADVEGRFAFYELD